MSDPSTGTPSWPETPATPPSSGSSFSEAGWQQPTVPPAPQPGWGQSPAQAPAPGTWQQPPQSWPQQQPAAPTPTWQQPPVQPPMQSWQQAPAQPSWGQQASGWGDPNVVAPAEHHHSFAVALASVFLGFWGLLFTVIGIVSLAGGSLFLDAIRNQGNLTPDQVSQFAAATGVVGVVLLIIGLPHLLAAMWAPLHSGWARVLGIIVSVLGVLIGLVALTTRPTSSLSASDTQASGLGVALFFLIPYGFSLVALILSRKHFRR